MSDQKKEAAAAAPDAELASMAVIRETTDQDGDGKADPDPKSLSEVGVYNVLIERSNNEKVSAEVFAYEIPVLEAVHGEQAITFPGYAPGTEVDEVDPEYSVKIDGDAHHVLRILQGKYNSTIAGDVVSRVYRDAKELSEKSGVRLAKGKAKEVPQSENVDHRKSKAKSK